MVSSVKPAPTDSDFDYGWDPKVWNESIQICNLCWLTYTYVSTRGKIEDRVQQAGS